MRVREELSSEIWSYWGLPERLDGLTFAEVGCWEGYLCGEAGARGAAHVLGLDYCTADSLRAYRRRVPFDFIQMDVFSEKFLQLPEYDVVLSAGVLYHTENPLSFVFRLRKLCKLGGWLYVESTVVHDGSDRPIMVFHPGSALEGNPSNWWSPNEPCLREMMAAAGFDDLETTLLTRDATSGMGRICMKGRAANSPSAIPMKVLPRRPEYMPDLGSGDRDW